MPAPLHGTEMLPGRNQAEPRALGILLRAWLPVGHGVQASSDSCLNCFPVMGLGHCWPQPVLGAVGRTTHHCARNIKVSHTVAAGALTGRGPSALWDLSLHSRYRDSPNMSPPYYPHQGPYPSPGYTRQGHSKAMFDASCPTTSLLWLPWLYYWPSLMSPKAPSPFPRQVQGLLKFLP